MHTHNGSKLRVLQQQEAHKWLGCMINAAASRNTRLDLQHHFQAASTAFHANKWILCDKGVSVLHRFHYFEKVISPVACFGASHRAIHKDVLAKLDVEYRRLMRMIVGPPADTNWTSPWHEILDGWNNKVQVLSDYAELKLWSVTCVETVWKFASYVATLPSERWTRRILEWNIRGPRKRGRPAYTWETVLQRYSIWKGGGNWIVEAAAYDHWMRSLREFVGLLTLRSAGFRPRFHVAYLNHYKICAMDPASKFRLEPSHASDACEATKSSVARHHVALKRLTAQGLHNPVLTWQVGNKSTKFPVPAICWKQN